MERRHIGCRKPRGCLMVEHRLIERVIQMIANEKKRLEAGGDVDVPFIEKVVDFIKIYADRTHHGKEEDILFVELEGRPLSEDEDKAMRELIDEHKTARRLTNALVGLKDAYVAGDTGKIGDIIKGFQDLVDLYPQHIEKEDKFLFPKTERHFSDEELDQMLRDFYDFDMRMIHEKYYDTVDAMEQQHGLGS